VATLQTIKRRVANKWRRLTIEHFARRRFRLNSGVSYISFTFDDFPRSALLEGGRILSKHGVRGTYFVSLNLLGSMSPSGRIASSDELHTLVGAGHELGCHTFEHLDGTRASAEDFERSIAANRSALAGHGIDAAFSVFAYPLDGPVVGIKRAVGRHFAGCRGGGQTCNRDVIDLNLLKAYFLDRRAGGTLDSVRKLIDLNAAAGGWLIFATHDVVPTPSLYGVQPAYLDAVVRFAIESGARVLPMARVCGELGVAN
jgi:peptidoglycan/xylan/chitin deacetylase (PgdA/CDA1 family)